MSKNNLYLYFYIFLFILLFSNNYLYSQKASQVEPKPVLSAEINVSDYAHKFKYINKYLAVFRGLVINESRSRNLYPLLNYIFFDEGKSDIPEWYVLLDVDKTSSFSDTTLIGDTMDKYYNLLNIYAYRLIHNPNSKLKIIGCNDNQSKSEQGNIALSKARALSVLNYFKNVWKIDENRIEVSWRNSPKHPTSSKDDPIAFQENRRVEIICDAWCIVKPFFDYSFVREAQPSTMNFNMNNSMNDELIADRRIEIKIGNKDWITLSDIGISEIQKIWNWKNIQNKLPNTEEPFTAQLIITNKCCEEFKSDSIVIPVYMSIFDGDMRRERGIDSTREIYNLLLFPFNSYEIAAVNQRILNEYIYPRVYPSSVIEIIGHNDNIGTYSHSMKLSKKRVKNVSNGIIKKTKGKYASMTIQAVGEKDPFYTNYLPECRFYNRIVQVFIKTDLREFVGE